MHKGGLLTTLAILVVFIGCTTIQRAQDVPRISKDELKAKLESPDMMLIDVRADSDWKKSDEKIKGAIRMDPGTVDSWAATLPKDKEIILYCA
jgi:rhodanese-related sulfurtransferase